MKHYIRVCIKGQNRPALKEIHCHLNQAKSIPGPF